MSNTKKNLIKFIWLFYFVCFAFRAFEYFVVRTDQSIIGEAFIHKLVGIGLLAAAVRYFGYRWRDIGFRLSDAPKGVCYGLIFGGAIFAASYGVEMIAQASASNMPYLRFYLTSYAVEGNRVMEGGTVFILICVLGNIINVIMEEGVFRGLFVKLAEQKYSFIKACLFSSLLFGFWHIVAPVRNVINGVQSLTGAVMMGLILIMTSALAGIQYVMLFKMTGTLWIPMTFHFINNASANLVHVVTASGADELQTVRLTIAGALSFIIVLIMFLKYRKNDRGRTRFLRFENGDIIQ
ncbi:MAG: CPBP family intramembrane metalloprotease [Clostridiales bacterium]|jgi:membrane protease YdiL (CAAX protease family)|nr:CPBP family intramembrane metalloprotease [Clostridiales bacterium]